MPGFSPHSRGWFGGVSERQHSNHWEQCFQASFSETPLSRDLQVSAKNTHRRARECSGSTCLSLLQRGAQTDRWRASRGGDNPPAPAGPLWHLPRDWRKKHDQRSAGKAAESLVILQHHLRPKHSMEEMFQRGTRKGGSGAPQRTEHTEHCPDLLSLTGITRQDFFQKKKKKKCLRLCAPPLL